jgi:hypothetical protein
MLNLLYIKTRICKEIILVSINPFEFDSFAYYLEYIFWKNRHFLLRQHFSHKGFGALQTIDAKSNIAQLNSLNLLLGKIFLESS